MKLLIITQKIDMNDDLLGFFHGWIVEFAKSAEKITVITLGVGEHDLPANVKVLSLGKEQAASRLKYVYNFYKYIWRYRRDYDAVFVHMNKEYVILGGLFWRLTGKKIALWYQHKKVSLWLKLAEIISNVIFTASAESFKLKSKKVKFVGHGIDADRFSVQPNGSTDDNFKIICVGRISEIKNQKLLIEAADILINQRGMRSINIEIIGASSNLKDGEYLKELQLLVNKYNLENYVNFIGRLPNKDIAQHYWRADLTVNLCPTGGLDKAVLESLAAGVPAIALNKIFSGIFKGYEPYFILDKDDPAELAEKILRYKSLSGREKIAAELKDRIKKDYGLENLIKKIAEVLQP